MVLDLYRHTFLKDCGSHDKKTPAQGMEREPDPAPGDGREGVSSGHLGMVEKGSVQGIWGWSKRGHFRAFGGLAHGGVFFSYGVWSSHSVGGT